MHVAGAATAGASQTPFGPTAVDSANNSNPGAAWTQTALLRQRRSGAPGGGAAAAAAATAAALRDRGVRRGGPPDADLPLASLSSALAAFAGTDASAPAVPGPGARPQTRAPRADEHEWTRQMRERIQARERAVEASQTMAGRRELRRRQEEERQGPVRGRQRRSRSRPRLGRSNSAALPGTAATGGLADSSDVERSNEEAVLGLAAEIRNRQRRRERERASATCLANTATSAARSAKSSASAEATEAREAERESLGGARAE